MGSAVSSPVVADRVDYQRLSFPYRRSTDQDAAQPAHHAVIVVGAGPVGLSLAIDLAQRGVHVVVIDDDCRLSTGSRAICFAKRTLEIFDRLGCGDRVAGKGVAWSVGKVFFRDEQVYRFDLLPEPGHERPAFVNLQQYYVEGYLLERAAELPGIEIRWRHRLAGIEPRGEHVRLRVETPDGPYDMTAGYVAACDGSRSTARRLLGQESKGRVFHDRFLIADVKMLAPFPAERWFWFDPPFHRRQSVLLHMQPDGIWRVDFQLGAQADAEEEKKPQKVVPRVEALLAASGMEGAPFELQWASVYTFSCARMERFRHGRVVFAGDSAHCVSPFGARGANSGVQDADNLAWKLALVLRGQAPDALLDSYASERESAADENILNSTRSTDFITPKSEISRLFRNAVLDLAKEHPFARALVNSGRLSVPSILRSSPLNTPDVDAFEGRACPGAPAPDAPIRRNGRPTWLLRELGPDFTLLMFGPPPGWTAEIPLKVLSLHPEEDVEGLCAHRYDLTLGAAYLLRPDRHVCARWRRPGKAQVVAAMARSRALAPAGRPAAAACADAA